MDPSDGARAPDDVAVRRDVAINRLARLSPADEHWESIASPVAMTVVDALLHADVATLEQLAEPLRHAAADFSDSDEHGPEIRGYLLGLLSATRWALERLPDPAQFELLEDSQARRMLDALTTSASLTSQELRTQLDTGDSQVSRTGRMLLAGGLVVQRRAGRVAIWELTPRGRTLMDGNDHSRSSSAS
jgi:DNA-binding transcriptional ArsR family regulator